MAEHGPSSNAARSLRTALTRTLRPLLIAASVLLLAQQEARATHAMGGELSYDCIGPNLYKVSLNFYRDCNGVAAPTNCNNGLEFNVRSPQCGANFTQCFAFESVQVITPICASETDRCLNPGGTYGVEKYTYSKIVNLAAWAGCGTDWTFSWSLCCRNNAITSLTNPGNQNLYLDATMNNTLGVCNSSPDFLTNPTPFYCLGQSVSYNPGAFDVDGDSLVFQLIAARGANGNNLTYAANYSAAQPVRNSGGINAVQLNAQTGTMTVVPSVLQVAVVTYRVREYRNGVQIGTVTRDIQVVVRACAGNTAPTASGVNGTNNYSTSVCAGTPITFTVNSSDPNVGQNVTMSWNSGIPTASFTIAGSPFPTGTFNWTPTVGDIGNNVFTVNVVDDACPLIGTNDFGFSVTVTPPFTAAAAGPDQSVCGASATLAAQLPFNQVQGTWSVVSGSGVFANANDPNTTVSGLAQGANVFQWSVNYLTCGIATDQVTVTSFNAGQAASNAGADQSLCLPANSTNLAANTAVAPAVGTWILVGGTGNITAPNSPTSTVTGLSIGANTFRWTINNGPCGAPTQDEVTVFVFDNAQAAANAGPDQQLCTPTTSTTLAGNAPTFPATGVWTVQQGTGVFANANSPSSGVSGLSIGVNRFRWTINNGPCAPPTTNDDVIITVFNAASPNANAGPDLQLCAPPNSITITGNTPLAPATGVWTLVSGQGSITSPNNPSTLLTNLGLGVNVFQWTVNNGPCANGVTTDQMSVTVFSNASPAANAGADQDICSNNNSTFLTGNTPISPALGTWTLESGSGTIVSINDPGTQVTGLGIGNNVFRWTVNNGPCAVGITFDLVTIHVYDENQAPANAGPDQSICSTTPSTSLAGNAPTVPATGTWSLISGQGNIVSPNNPNSLVTGLGVGANVFEWTVDNGPCQNPISTDQVTISVYDVANPVANAGADQSLCGSTSTTLSGSNVIAPAIGTWTLVSGNGTVASPNAPNTQITGMSVGANVFRWTVDNGPCGAPTQDDVTVLVFDPNQPAANAGVDQQLCTPTTSTSVTGSSVTFPGTGVWTVVSGTATITTPNSSTTTVTGLGVGVIVLQWTVNNGPCGAPTNDQVTITLFDSNTPIADAGPDQEICIPTFPSEVTLSGSPVIAPAVGTWTLVSGAGNIVDPNSPFTLVTGLAVGVNVFRWTVDNGACANSLTTDEVSIFVFDAANPVANAGPDQSLCTPISTTVLSGSSLIVPATGTWTLVSGTGVIVSPNDPNSQVTGLTVGSNVFAWTVSNGPCANPITTDQVTINIFNGSAQPAEAGPDQTVCSTTTTVTMAGNAPTGLATGSWSVITGTANFTDATSASTTVTGLSVGTNTLQWTIDNGACGLSSDLMIVTVFDSNQANAAAGPDQQICIPDVPNQVAMAGNAITFPAVGTWTLVSGAGTILDPNDPNTVITGLAVGTNVFQWTILNGPCANGNTNDQVTVTVFDAGIAAANAGPDQDLCTPTTTTVMAGSTVAFPAVGTWTVVQGAGVVIVSPNSPTTQVTGLQVGETILRWAVDNGVCAAPSADTVSVFLFDANNPNANAGADQELCILTTASVLSGSDITFPATGTWTVIAGSGVFSDPNAAFTNLSGYSIGVNLYTWTVDNGPCANGITTDTVQVTVYDNTNLVSNAGPDQEYCTPDDAATLDGSELSLPATGLWTLVNGTAIITDPNDPNTTVTDLGIGINTFNWQVDNGPCVNGITNDQVSILVFDATNPAADAGPDQELCPPNTSTVMAGSNLITPATGTWTLISGQGTIADANSPTTAISNLAIGENVFEWTVSNGPCANPLTTDQVSIFVFDENNPVANAGPDQEICTPIVNATLAGSAITFPAQGTWTLVSGQGTIADPNDPATTVSDLAVGENIFEWTVSNGPCANGLTTDQVSIFLFDGTNANADAGPDQELCTPNLSTTLAGNAPIFPAAGSWSLVSGQGDITDPSDPNSGVTNLAVGENVFAWTVDNGPCTNGLTTDQVSIFVFDEFNPNADAGPDQELCAPDNSTTLAGSALTFPASGLWTVVSGTVTILDPTDPNSAVTDLVVGEVILEWTVSNGPCANGITTDQVSIQVYDPNNNVASAGPDQDLCTPTTSAVLAASTTTFPSVGTWTVINGGGTFVDDNDPATTVNGLLVGENILVWTVDNGPCVNGITSDTLSIFLYDENNPVANAGPDQELCEPNTSTTFAGSALIFPATGTWTLVTGTGDIADPSDPNSAVSNLTVGENVFLWTVSNGPCNNPITTDLVSIFLFDDGNPDANAGPDQDICTPITSATMSGSAVTFPAVGTWVLVNGQGIITDPNSPTTTITGLGIGLNEFSWTVDNGPCANGITTDNVVIQLFDENAPPANAGPDQELCAPDNTVLMVGNPPVGVAQGTWTVILGAGNIVDPNDPLTEINGIPIGENQFVWTMDNSVCGISRDTMSVFVFDPSNPQADAGPDQELCVPTDSTFMAGNTPIFPASGTWTVIAGTGVFPDPTDPGALVNNLSIGVNTFRWTTSNGPCANSITFDDINVILFDDSTSAADAGPDQEVCLPLTSTVMAAAVPQLPATGSWSLLSGTGDIVDPANPASVINNLDVGINVFVWTLDNGPCPPNGIMTDTMSIYVYDPAAPTANAGPDQFQCTPDLDAMMFGNIPADPGVGTWTLASGTGTITQPNNPFTLITDMAVGENIFVWTIYNGQCGFGPPSTDTMSVFVYDENQPPAQTGNDLELCTPTTSAVLTANDPIFPATGQWIVVQGGGSLADPADPNTAVFNLTVGDNVFVWTIDNGPCPNAITNDTMTVVLFDENSPAADAGPDQEICVPTFPNTVTMNASVPIYPSTGSWTLVSGTGTITDPGSATTTITDLQVGVSVFEWTISNGPCNPGQTSDQVSISVFDAAQGNANAGPDQQLCTPLNSASLAGNALILPATGLWTVVSGSGTLVSPTDPTTSINGLTVGVTTLVWTISNGPCANALTTDTLVISVFDGSAPDALAGDDQSFCSPAPNATMFASSPVLPAIGTWALLSGTGAIANPNDPFTAISGLGLGESVFEWTISNGVCGSTTDQVSFFVYNSELPPADAGEDQQYCQHEFTSADLDAEPVVDLLATGVWSLIGGSGTIFDPTDPSATVEGLSLGDNFFLWTVNNGVCGTTVDSVLVNLEDCLSIIVPDAFSPNGDGVNDTYVIHNLESYPDNSLIVFNRWGAKVLDRNPYTNDWNGTSENSMNWGEELPEGTYYYVLDLGTDADPLTGYIYIRR
ncbi:MAG: gliding motility-associated C-terminal domain-containing protein [Flavobacteriales bacterium]|nr:gliding motility-associated C-terminal domain-containing protein [Flavobacteriales bacterium]